MSPQSRLWSTRSQQGIVLAETAQEGAKVTAMGTRAGIVTDRLARVALGETTAATKQSCGQCSLHCRVTDAEPDTGPRGVRELVVLLRVVLTNFVPCSGEARV